MPPARPKYNGLPLKVNGGPAATVDCCCGCIGCVCVHSLPDTIYMNVTWCSVPSSIALDIYYYYTSPLGDFCEKRYSGTGSFGAGGPAFFRVSVISNCDEDGNSYFYLRYCFDGCTTGECSADPNDVATWTLMSNSTCDPLYGEGASAAPPGACGMCMEGYTLTVSE